MSPPKDLQSGIREYLWREEKPPVENADRAQIARLGLEKNREILNAFIEQIAPDRAHDADHDEFKVPVCHGITLHLSARTERVKVWGEAHGASILPTAPAQMNPTLQERCAEVIADGLSLVHSPMLTSLPAWAVEHVRREFRRRCELFASYAEAAESMALQDALWRVDLEMQRRGKVAPENLLPALMEAGLSCSWVEDRPPGEVPFVGLAPALRALVDAMGRAGLVPYVRLDADFDGNGPHKLSLGGEVLICEKYDTLNAVHSFVTRPSAMSFDFLLGALARVTNPAEIIGHGPIASWCREQIKAR